MIVLKDHVTVNFTVTIVGSVINSQEAITCNCFTLEGNVSMRVNNISRLSEGNNPCIFKINKYVWFIATLPTASITWNLRH